MTLGTRMKRSLLVICCTLGILSCRTVAKNNQDLPKSVADSAARLEGAVISKVEYYYLQENAQTQIAVEPDALVRTAPYKAIVTNIPQTRLLKIATALKAEIYVPIKERGDMRLGGIFYDQSGNRFLSIFFDQSGQRVLINGSLFRVRGDLRDILRQPIL